MLSSRIDTRPSQSRDRVATPSSLRRTPTLSTVELHRSSRQCGASMRDEQTSLLEQIRQAFAAGDEDRGYDLVADAIERLEMPTETVARALSAGLEAWRPT